MEYYLGLCGWAQSNHESLKREHLSQLWSENMSLEEGTERCVLTMKMDERAASQGMQAALETKDKETEPLLNYRSLFFSLYMCVCVCVYTFQHTHTHILLVLVHQRTLIDTDRIVVTISLLNC